MAQPTCTKNRSDGEPCQAKCIPGFDFCNKHGGQLPNVRRASMIKREISQWVPGDITEDPGEVLLRLVTQSYRRAALYSNLLEQLYERASLGLSTDEDFDAPPLPGGLQALIGGTYSATNDGRLYRTGEQIRGLVALEAAERERCANFSMKAVSAGLAERQVRIAERAGQAIIDGITAALDRAGITGQQRMLAQAGAADYLESLS